jgi:hypothetical protein
MQLTAAMFLLGLKGKEIRFETEFFKNIAEK